MKRLPVICLALFMISGCGGPKSPVAKPEPVASTATAIVPVVLAPDVKPADSSDDEENSGKIAPEVEFAEVPTDELLQKGWCLLIDHQLFDCRDLFEYVEKRPDLTQAQKDEIFLGQALTVACLCAELEHRSKTDWGLQTVKKAADVEFKKFGRKFEDADREKAVQYQYLRAGLLAMLIDERKAAAEFLTKSHTLELRNPFLCLIAARAALNWLPSDNTATAPIEITSKLYSIVFELLPTCERAAVMLTQLKGFRPGDPTTWIDLPVINLPVFSAEKAYISDFVQVQAKIFAEKLFFADIWPDYKELQSGIYVDPTNISSRYEGFVNIDTGTCHLVSISGIFRQSGLSKNFHADFRIRDSKQWDLIEFTVNNQRVNFKELEAQKLLNEMREADAVQRTQAQAAEREKEAEAKRQAALDKERRIAEERERAKRVADEQREEKGDVNKAFFEKPRTWRFNENDLVGTLILIDDDKAVIRDERGALNKLVISRFSNKDVTLMKTFVKHFPEKNVQPKKKSKR